MKNTGSQQLMNAPLMNSIVLSSLLFILGYILLTLAFVFLSDSVLFQPPRPSTYKSNAHDHTFLSEGQRVHATYLPNPKSAFVLLYSHGNAEDLGTLSSVLDYYHHQGYALFAYDYRGYGLSEGRASESNTYQDIQGAYKYLTENLGIAPARIIVYGRSLGSGPSVELASKKPVAGLILESAFVSAYRVYTRAPLFIFDKYQNQKKINGYKGPLLIVHGRHDSIIPQWHGKALYESYKGPKQAAWLEGNHNDLLVVAGPSYWLALKNFIHTLEK